MPGFSTSFTPPDPVSGLEVAADLEASAIRLSWDTTAIAEVDFGGYRVYRSTDGVNYTELVLLPGVNDVEYDDYEAPLNEALRYRVTQSNLDFESAPVEATVSLDSQAWWVVRPDNESLTFAITKIRAAPLTRPKVQDLYTPIGRPTRLAVGDVALTEEGAVTFLVMPDDEGKIALLHGIQEQMEGSILLKAPDGVVHRVQFGDMTRSFTNIPGLFEVTLPFFGAG